MSKRPNILLFFPDQHRGDWMPYPAETAAELGLPLLPLRMPNIQKMMENGVSFCRTMSPSPLCAPARACLASGYRYESCGVLNNQHDYDLSIPTFYAALRDAGYSVGGVGKFDVHKNTPVWGLDGWCDFLDKMGFTEGIDNAGKYDAAMSGAETPQDPYMALLHEKGWGAYHAKNIMERRLSVEPTELPDELYCDNWIGGNASRMIEGFSKEKSWFLQVNFAGPHNPWDVTKSMRARWETVDFPAPNRFEETDQYDINGIRQNYAAMLENIDRICGEVLKTVENRGELENTVIIYSADHGEMLGDCSKFGKSVPERGSVHIPLVFSGAGIPKAGRMDDSPAELQDLASTILDFCGITDRFTEDSLSLRGTIQQELPLARNVQTSALRTPRSDWKLFQNEDYKVVLYDGEIREVYDLEQDVWENHNLFGENSPAAKQTVFAALKVFGLLEKAQNL